MGRWGMDRQSSVSSDSGLKIIITKERWLWGTKVHLLVTEPHWILSLTSSFLDHLPHPNITHHLILGWKPTRLSDMSQQQPQPLLPSPPPPPTLQCAGSSATSRSPHSASHGHRVNKAILRASLHSEAVLFQSQPQEIRGISYLLGGTWLSDELP